MNLTAIKTIATGLTKTLTKDYDMTKIWKFINNILQEHFTARRCFTKLLGLSEMFLKFSQISLENTCGRYNVNVKRLALCIQAASLL